MTPQDYVIILMIRGNTTDFIDHPLPKDSISAYGASHHAWAPVPPPSKSGAVRGIMHKRGTFPRFSEKRLNTSHFRGAPKTKMV